MVSRLIDIPAVAGMREDVEALNLQTPSFVLVDNIKTDKTGRHSKRDGASALGNSEWTTAATLGAVEHLFTRGDELCAIADWSATGRSLFSYGAADSKWSWKGYVPDCSYAEHEPLGRGALNWDPSGVAFANFRALYASRSRIVIRDDLAGTTLRDVPASTVMAASTVAVRVVSGTSTLFLVWLEGAAAPYTLRAAYYDTTGIAVAVSAAVTLGADVRDVSAWDVAAFGNDLYCAYYDNAALQLRIKRFDSTLGAGASVTQAVGGAGAGRCTIFPTTERAWIVYSNTTDGLNYWTANITTLVLAAGPYVIDAAATGTDTSYLALGMCRASSTAVYLLASRSGTDNFDSIFMTLGSGGTSYQHLRHHWCYAAAKPWVVGSRAYAMLVAAPNVSVFQSNAAFSSYIVAQCPVSTAGAVDTLALGGQWRPVAVFGQGLAPAYRSVAGQADPLPVAPPIVSGGDYLCSGLETYDAAQSFAGEGFSTWRLRFGEATWTSATIGNTACIGGGGIALCYDGSAAQELGFAQAPAIRAHVDDTSGGAALPNSATFSYIAVFEFVDANGDRHYSVPSAPVTHTTAAIGNITAITLTLTPSTLTHHPASWVLGVDAPRSSVVLYRTENGGSIYYQVQLTPVANDVTAQSLTVSDATLDTSLVSRRPLYTEGGAVPSSFAFAARALTTSPDRLFWADDLYVYSSKSYVPGAAPARHDSFATYSGPATAVQSVDDGVIVWDLARVGMLWGQGPDDQGSGAFSPIRWIPASSGCIDPRSVALFPGGTLFQSARGIEAVPRGFGAPQWIGEPVRDSLDTYFTIVAATPCANENVVRFACVGDGATQSAWLVYDYDAALWWRETHATSDVCAGVYWDDTYVYGTILPRVERRDPTVAYDVSMSAGFVTETWVLPTLRPDSLAAEQLLVTLTVIGEWRGDFDLAWSIVTDQDDGGTVTDSGTASFATASGYTTAGQSVIWRHALVYPRGRAHRITVSDAKNGSAATSGFRLAGFALELEETTSAGGHVTQARRRLASGRTT